jgi:hypothetical protein
MSTRCQCGFISPDYIEGKKGKNNKKYERLLYFHSDGYPKGILPYLIPFLIIFNKKRGLKDISYASAWLMHHMIKARDCDYNTLEECDFLSHGIDDDLHGDIEYFYEIYPDRLNVYGVNKVFANNTFRGDLLKEISLEKDIDEFTINMIIESLEEEE